MLHVKHHLGLAVLLWLVFSASGVRAQSYTVSGTVLDSNRNALPAATVMVMQARDSVLYQFGITEEDGRFVLKGLAAGSYVLQLSYTGFESHLQPLNLQGSPADMRIGAIRLFPRVAVLAEAEIQAERIPILFKKDTVEYDAAAFRTQPNAAVEDLLRKLPGVKVDRDGNVKAYGETVEKVLVDGKEFFGNDPQVATRNLPADAVDRVQVFDKRSELSEFTGVDDGERDKTINLKLKADKKKGYFGNVTGGYGDQQRYEGKLNLNRFTGKTQLAAIGMANNTNRPGFSFDEYLNFIGGLQGLLSGGGVTLDQSNIGVPIGAGQSSGFNTVWAGGLNLGHDLSPRTTLRSSYFYNRVKQEQTRESFRQNLSQESRFDSDARSRQQTRSTNHRLNAKLKHEIDSLQDLIWTTGLRYNDGTVTFASQESRTEMGLPERVALANNRSNGRSPDLNSSLTYRRKLGKRGRSWVTRGAVNWTEQENDATVNTINQWFGQVQPPDTAAQVQESYLRSTVLEAQSRFTEPLGNKRFVDVRYGLVYKSHLISKAFFDRSDLLTEMFNPLLSNRYGATYFAHEPGVGFQMNTKSHVFTLGINGHFSRLQGDPSDLAAPLDRHFRYWLPRLRWKWSPSAGNNLTVDYVTQVQEPDVRQLQPVVDNSDPLNTFVGNPGLEPVYRHQAAVRLLRYNQFSFTSIFANARMVHARQAITNAVAIDSSLVQVTQPVNVDAVTSVDGSVGLETPLPWRKVAIRVEPQVTYFRNRVPINGVINTSNQWISALKVQLENRNQERVQLLAGAELRQNNTTYSVSTALNSDFLTQSYFADATITFRKHWTITSSIDHTRYPAGAFSPGREVTIWNASVARQFLKNKRATLEVAVTDLLDQNVGITQTSQANTILEERVFSLGRFVLVSFTYALRNIGK